MLSDPPSPAPIRDIGMRYDASRSIPLVSNREMFWALENTVSTVCVVGLRMICAHAAELPLAQIGRASCRERVCQYVYISVVAVSLKKKQQIYLNRVTPSK